MTLEKLLVFGLALAVLGGISSIGLRTGESRNTQQGGYTDNVDALVEKAR